MSKQYFITREGEQAGPYTLEQIQQMQAADQLLPSDMAWTEGQADWLPLSQIVGDTPPPPPTQGAIKTGKSLLIVRIVLGVLLVIAIVIASLSLRANKQYNTTYEKIADLRDNGEQDTLEGFHKKIGREPDSNQNIGQLLSEETYEWNGLIRKYQIRVQYFTVDEEKKMLVIRDVIDSTENSENE